MKTSGSYRLYKVNVLGGRASAYGAFPAGHQVVDLALPLNQN